MKEPTLFRCAGTEHHTPNGAWTSGAINVPEEVPVEIRLNGLPHAVMMATPADLDDFTRGFLLSETIARTPADILGVEIVQDPLGFVARAQVAKDGLVAASQARRRGLEGRSGCGLCGVRSLQDALREPERVSPPPILEPKAIDRALASLADIQSLNQKTRAVHGAAWCNTEGRILAIREDVGRHNALDKLIGWRAYAANVEAGFCLITSRCSFEMVSKAAAADISILVAVSSPTGLALDIAVAAGMTIVARARSDSYLLFQNQVPHGQ